MARLGMALQNNVCVLGLGPGSLATGSTGLSVEGHLVGQQIRIWEGSPPKVRLVLALMLGRRIWERRARHLVV